jgi:FKBP-type peptidyl-prolyl cis-trans isomerase
MKKSNFSNILLILTSVLFISLVSCNPDKKYTKEERTKIEDFLAKNVNLNFVHMSSGLYYLETVTGTGLAPVLTDSAFIQYTGRYLDGNVFSTSVGTGELYRCIVGRNISGFDEGILLMKQGGKSTLLIPSSLGYGAMGSYPIPGYCPLLFDIELVRVKHNL